MRKSIVAVIAVMTLASTAVHAQNYQQATRDAQRQSWENAGMGIALEAAGTLIGAAVGTMVTPAPRPGYAPQTSYAPQTGYAPPVVNPYYYPPAQACITQRAPVYDAYGRVVEFVQYCAQVVR